MHVIFLDTVSNPKQPGKGGLSDINWNLAHELSSQYGVKVTVIGPYDINVKTPYPDVRCIIPKNLLRQRNIFTFLHNVYQLGKEARNCFSGDVVYHVSDSITAAVVSLLGLGKRAIWHGHSNVFYNSRYGIPWSASFYILMLLSTFLASRKIRYVVALGQSMKPWWRRVGFEEEQIAVIPNGINLYNADNIFQEGFSQPNVWKPSRKKLLYVGRLAPDKGGYCELIDAIEELKNDHFPVGLVFVGDGNLKENLQAKVKTMHLENEIQFIGSLPYEDVLRTYKAADLVILPSVNETMPRVMLECWVTGTPFMANATGTIPDYLIDGYNGYLLDSLERRYFADRIRRAFNSQSERMEIIHNGKSGAERCSWLNVAAQYTSLYQKVLGF